MTDQRRRKYHCETCEFFLEFKITHEIDLYNQRSFSPFTFQHLKFFTPWQLEMYYWVRFTIYYAT
jgi:hypothetical protein